MRTMQSVYLLELKRLPARPSAICEHNFHALLIHLCWICFVLCVSQFLDIVGASMLLESSRSLAQSVNAIACDRQNNNSELNYWHWTLNTIRDSKCMQLIHRKRRRWVILFSIRRNAFLCLFRFLAIMLWPIWWHIRTCN